MSDVSFDTHAEIRKLEERGIPLPQAEALVDMVTRAPTDRQVAETLEYPRIQVDTNMATKADIAEIRAELAALRDETFARFEARHDETNARFDAQDREINIRFDAQNQKMNARFDAQNREMNARFDAQNKETKAGFAALREAVNADIATLRADLYRALWLQGSVLAALILALAGVILAFATLTISSS